MIDKFTKYLNSINNDIFKNVSFLQKRKRKCNIKNLFSTMIASSFGDNKECNFKFLYNSNKNISESTRSYWRSKIYNLHLPYDAYSYDVIITFPVITIFQNSINIFIKDLIY